MITDHVFWQLIDEAREAAGGDPFRQIQTLQGMLQGRPRDEIVQFAAVRERLYWQAFTWDCWGAGHCLAGGMTEDAFADFREWLISRGEQVYRTALEDPEKLLDVVKVSDGLSAEGLGSVAGRAYEATYNGPLPSLPDTPTPPEPEGEPWEEDDLAARFPRLWKWTFG